MIITMQGQIDTIGPPKSVLYWILAPSTGQARVYDIVLFHHFARGAIHSLTGIHPPRLNLLCQLREPIPRETSVS